ncbi:MAG: HypC/HybG/HupF family hydrogenase formation chaperone [Desulfovibrio sp.]|jgi:hydrogenase expression/formation protein HypC|nr:HypC/HybG/HupF family hydrogenase formation chaperone [Desulfovibrio sp.]
MCLAVPVKVLELFADNEMARCRVGEGETFVNASLALLEEAPKPGEYLIVHAGFALRKLEPDDAEETIHLLRSMLAASV